MHELGLLTTVVAAVEQAVQASPTATRASAVGLRVGSMSGTTVEALQGAWPIAIHGSCLDGATLDVEHVQAAVHCLTCREDREIDEFYALVCPVCQTPTGNLVRGREFDVAWADLESD
ncbi:hydrogenase maturation nickel metallochaperone HypA [Luteococcus sp. OSA5]|uniref:hydrogenase maturation nickel metallochaperone HypA/HybF n=1 Tax=Luteococcus sp. OSA5 TaxID=3401630 RepID=UPI003B43C85B